MGSDRFDVALVDMHMPGMGGLELIREIKATYPETDVIVVTGFGTVDVAVEAMKRGATDFITKPFELSDIQSALAQAAVCHANGLACHSRDDRNPAEYSIRGGAPVVGASPSMRRVFEMVEAVKDSRCSVLIDGESGTGKELVACAIHANGRRRGGPFVAVNCASIAQSLLESQLFGHVKGAFTGADHEGQGFFRAADGGTLFLDEITEIDSDVQAKLLRAIQEGQIIPVGSTEPVSVDVRILGATNRDVREARRQGILRNDLFYRLNVVSIHVPPLRERDGDLPLLIDHFRHTCAGDYGLPVKRVHRDALRVLEKYEWPGNVRELQNLIERCYALDPGPIIEVPHLPEDVRSVRTSSDRLKPEGVPTWEESERMLLERALTTAGGNKSEAARLLNLNRRRVYRLIERYGIEV